MSRRRLVTVLSVVCVAALGVTAVVLTRGGSASGDPDRTAKSDQAVPAVRDPRAPRAQVPRSGHRRPGHMTPGGRATSTPLR